MRINEDVGYDMTFKILNSATTKIINGSNVVPINDVKYPNLRANLVTSPEAIKSLTDAKFKHKDATSEHASYDRSLFFTPMTHVHSFDTTDLVGRRFLLDKEVGQSLRDRLVEDLDYFEGHLALDLSRCKFI